MFRSTFGDQSGGFLTVKLQTARISYHTLGNARRRSR